MKQEKEYPGMTGQENGDIRLNEMFSDVTADSGKSVEGDGAEVGGERPEDEHWKGEQGKQSGNLFGRILSPFTDPFNSLSDKQKGTYILIVGIGAILVGLILTVKLIIENV